MANITASQGPGAMGLQDTHIYGDCKLQIMYARNASSCGEKNASKIFGYEESNPELPRPGQTRGKRVVATLL